MNKKQNEQLEKLLSEAFSAGFAAGKKNNKLNETVIDFPTNVENSEQNYNTDFYKNLFGFSGERQLETESVDELYVGDGLGIDYEAAGSTELKVAESREFDNNSVLLTEDWTQLPYGKLLSVSEVEDFADKVKKGCFLSVSYVTSMKAKVAAHWKNGSMTPGNIKKRGEWDQNLQSDGYEGSYRFSGTISADVCIALECPTQNGVLFN